ncbi:MAG: D-alanyl-D-alanine carboxypeptidase family protein [Clostridiaceae bacterium]|nr:D-alanyl-D-alanine carboxypeptidase family protein [Clostridiaceae bacterium]
MKRKVVILGTCIILFVGALSSETGHFKAGTDEDDTETGDYEYYYTNDQTDEDSEAELENFAGESEESEELIQVETNPDSYAVLVNRDYLISKDYVPADLVVPNVSFSFYGTYEKSYMRKKAAAALEKLFAGASENGYTLKGVSAYRSYERQTQIYNNNVQTKGEEKANLVSALPGSSEHQTGLAIDVSCNSVSCTLEESFGKTDEGKWLRKNCYRYGFVIRYPKGKEDITGYSYEPWHIRYVGKKLAKYLYKNDLTLEEYYQITTVEDQVVDDFISDTDNTSTEDEPEMTTAPTPKPTQQPAQSTASPTQSASNPSATRKPAATKKPSATQKPKKTKKPAATKTPESTTDTTQKPAATKEPEATKTPAATKTPPTTAPSETTEDSSEISDDPMAE